MKKLTSILVTMMLLTIIGASLNAGANPLPPKPPNKPIIEGDITEVETTRSYDVTVKTSYPMHNQVEYHIYVNDVNLHRYICYDLEEGITFSLYLTEGENYEIKAKAVDSDGLESGWSPILELKEEEDATPYPILSDFLARILEGRPFLSFLFDLLNK